MSSRNKIDCRLSGKQLQTIGAVYRQVFAACAVEGMMLDSRRAYARWARLFSGWLLLQPRETLPAEPALKIRAFLVDCADARVTFSRLGPVSINSARHALLFLYKNVRREPVGDIGLIPVAREPKRLPPVIDPAHVEAVIAAVQDSPWQPYQLMCRLLHCTGGRIRDVLRLRVKDIDWRAAEVVFRSGKGNKDRRTLLPRPILEDLRRHLARVRRMWEVDTRAGVPVALPDAVQNKAPRYGFSWMWYYLFPAIRRTRHPDRGHLCRYRCLERSLQLAVGRAAERVGVFGAITPHKFRHAFAQALLHDNVNIRQVQDLLGHESVETTMIYTHDNIRAPNVRAAVDRLALAGR